VETRCIARNEIVIKVGEPLKDISWKDSYGLCEVLKVSM
jgi:hypothetical protein